MNVRNNAEELIGRTPLLRLNNIEKKEQLSAELYAKLERFNLTASAKDRPAKNMLDEAEKRGDLKRGGTVIEPTSGNTGIAIAALSAVRGYRCIIVMPDSMSRERQLLMSAYGAELVLTPGAQGMSGAIKKAEELKNEIDGAIIAGQFVNPDNADAHYKTTGPEIFGDTDGEIDIFVASVGTGGTLTGTARFLKEKKPDVKVVAVEPAASPVLSGGKAGPHKIQGIGAGFVPEVLDTNIYDEVLTVTNEAAYECARLMCKTEGVLVGISSGAALSAAIALAKLPENKGKKIVLVMPDTGERYLSTPDFI